MVTSAAIAGSVIWLAATDPLQLATAAARGDVWLMLATVANQVLGVLW